MTLQNGLVMADTAYLWSDTGWFDPKTGEMKAKGSKYFLGTIFPFAISFSSSGGQPYAMLDHINDRYPFFLGPLLEASVSALRAYAETGHHGQLLIAAWEEGPHLYCIRSYDGLPGDNEPAFEPIEVLHFLCIGAGAPRIESLRSQGLSRRRMHRVIQTQRDMPFDYHESFGVAAPTKGIGGEIVEIAVSRRGVEHGVLRALEGASA